MQIESRNAGDELEISLIDGKWFRLLDPPKELSRAEGVSICRWIASQWVCMPGGQKSQIKLPNSFSQPAAEALTFYSGSFNPWHQGHRACLDLTPQKSIVVVPDSNPWKDLIHRNLINPWLEIVKLQRAIGGHYSIYPGFWSEDKVNPTVDWLPLTNLKWRGFIVGADSFVNILRWKNSEALLAAIDTLYVVPRNEKESVIDQVKKQILKIAPNIEVVILAHHPYEHLSSTNLRK